MLFPVSPSIGLLFTYFLIGAFVGGVKGALDNQSSPLRAVLRHSLACGVAGFAIGLVCLHALGTSKPYLSLLLVTLAGWIGPVIVDKVAAVVTDRLVARLPAAKVDDLAEIAATPDKKDTP